MKITFYPAVERLQGDDANLRNVSTEFCCQRQFIAGKCAVKFKMRSQVFNVLELETL